jgi:endo-1,4-beta-xylanase
VRKDGEPRRPLAFDDELQPKPAYDALISGLFEATDRDPLGEVQRASGA